MLRQKKNSYFLLEEFFFLKLFFIATILCSPQYLNRIFSQKVVASIVLNTQNKTYRLLKKIEAGKTSYFLQKTVPIRSLASNSGWIKKISQLFSRQKPKRWVTLPLTDRHFFRYFSEVKNLVWTLKYKYPNFELNKCKRLIAKLRIDQNTHLDICVSRPLGLAKLSPLLRKLQNL